MNLLLSAVLLSRPANCFLAAFAVWVGSYTSGIGGITPQVLWACFAAMAMTAAGNVSNDIADTEVDRLAKPNRPLASGIIGTGQAWILFGVLFLGGTLAGFAAGILQGILAALAGALLLLYNFRLKSVPVLGNLLVAVLAGFPFIYGGLLSSFWKWALIPFFFAFLVHWGREIIKSLEDRAGDMMLGIRTIAAVASESALRRLASGIFVFVLAASVLPYVLGWYGPLYLLVLLIGVAIPQIGILWQLLWAGKLNFSLIHGLLKIEMLAGSVAILLGR